MIFIDPSNFDFIDLVFMTVLAILIVCIGLLIIL
jgi:hypothetical protein